MHHLYLRKHEPGMVAGHGSDSDGDSDSESQVELDMEEDDSGAKPKPLVTYAFYTGRFNTFDLSFAKPLVDSCATCDEFKIQLSVATDEGAADALRAQRKLHLLEADRGYAMRKHDQELAEVSRKSEPGAVPSELAHNSWDGVEFVCSDMAGVLVTPRGAPTHARACTVDPHATYAHPPRTHSVRQQGLLLEKNEHVLLRALLGPGKPAFLVFLE
jgi:hypothetical protein